MDRPGPGKRPRPDLARLWRLPALVRRLLFEGGIVVETPFEAGAARPTAFVSVVQGDGDIVCWIDPRAVERRDLHGAHLEAIRAELATLTVLPLLIRGLPRVGPVAGLLTGAARVDLETIGIASAIGPLLWTAGGLALGWLLPLIIKVVLRVMPLEVPKDLENLVSSEESLREDARRCAGRA